VISPYVLGDHCSRPRVALSSSGTPRLLFTASSPRSSSSPAPRSHPPARCASSRPGLCFANADLAVPTIAQSDCGSPTAQRGRLHAAVNDNSSKGRNSSIGLSRPTTARMIPPRRRSIGPNSAEGSKPLPISFGTGSSNPFPSSGESSANLPT
jgi:hypothetical protein